jgi:hypothetical protein
MADATLILKIMDAQLAINNASPGAHLTIALDDLTEAGLTDDDIFRLENAGVHVVASISEEEAEETPEG